MSFSVRFFLLASRADRFLIFCTGEVVEGMEHIMTIDALGSASGKPKKKVTIIDCGVV
jgi:hypothetical protein